VALKCPWIGWTVAVAPPQRRAQGIRTRRKKTWTPGKTLQKFIVANFGIEVKEQLEIIEAISDAVSATVPRVREAMNAHQGFDDIGKRMLIAWDEGVSGLRDKRIYAMGEWQPGDAMIGFSAPPKMDNPKAEIGRSELLARKHCSK
jgi:serine/threonine-protein kinase HipA